MAIDKRKKILSGIGLVTALLAIYFLYEHMLYVTTDNAQIEAHSVMLAAKVGGYISAVHAQEGQKVKAGDVLAEIDSRDYENTLTQVKSELTSIEARRKEAEKNYRRLNELYAKGAISQQQFDASSSTYSETKAKYDAIAAQVAQAELNLANTKIRAPSNGFIAKRAVEIGQLAAMGVPLFGFVDAGERWVTANFKETEINNIVVGHKVWITVDALDGRTFTGKVDSISAATGSTFTLIPPDNATGNFTKVVQRIPVKIVFDDLKEADTDQLIAGLSANVKVRK